MNPDLVDAKTLLDQLMGRDRDIPLDQRDKTKIGPSFDDEEICKFFIVAFCPHDLFVNTRVDIGPCPFVHDNVLRVEYNKSPRCGTLGYETEMEKFLAKLMSEQLKRIERAKDRLKLSVSEGGCNNNPESVRQERILQIKARVESLVEEVEREGTAGNVDRARQLTEEIDNLETERLKIMAEDGQAEERHMEVCDICGAMLVSNDPQHRIDDHLLGKQHLGFARIKSWLEDYKDAKAAEEAKRDAERSAHREKREKERDDRRDKRGSSRERSKGSSRDRDRRESSRDSDRRDRSRSTRDRSERERDGGRRDRDRDRKRSRSRDRRRD